MDLNLILAHNLAGKLARQRRILLQYLHRLDLNALLLSLLFIPTARNDKAG